MTSQGSVLTLSRNFAAPRDGVFRAWTDEREMARWWGPRGYTATVCEIDACANGALRIHLRGPDSTVHRSRGVIHDFVPPERLAMTMIVDDASGRILIETFITAIFAARGDKTSLGVQVRVVQCAPEFAAARAGMADGWNQSFDRLAVHLRTA